MGRRIDFEGLQISALAKNDGEYEALRPDGMYQYVKWMMIDFALEDEGDTPAIPGQEYRESRVGRMVGALLLGMQASLDSMDFITLCDDCSADLLVVAESLDAEGVLEHPNGLCRNVFYVHTLELSSEIIDAANLYDFFGLIPRIIFQYANVMPDIVCYIADSNDGYYEKQAELTEFDPRSVDQRSPDLFEAGGYAWNKSKELLYRIHDCFSDEPEDDDVSFDLEEMPYLEDGDEDEEGTLVDFFGADRLMAERCLQEDHITIGCGPTFIHASRAISEKLAQYLKSAIIAYHLGTGMDYAFRMYASQMPSELPALYASFQRMYFAGKEHMEETLNRMNPTDLPTHGEVYADSALSRARNTYYVAAWLYREGHLIEGHALSRLMLEQVAWAFAVADAEDPEDAEIPPQRTINALKKKITPVGRMYGALSRYVHLPLEGHPEFMDLSSGKTTTIYQYGDYSLACGKVISYLADYWASVYEYTQSRHFETLENWIADQSGVRLNSERPFLEKIIPIRFELEQKYKDEHGELAAFIEEHWDTDMS